MYIYIYIYIYSNCLIDSLNQGIYLSGSTVNISHIRSIQIFILKYYQHFYYELYSHVSIVNLILTLVDQPV